MEKLELKHLASYLPYGLKILRPDGKTILSMDGIFGTLIMCKENDDVTYSSLSGCKPLLLPLSQLTQEIEHNGEKIIPIFELLKIAYPTFNFDFKKLRIENKYDISVINEYDNILLIFYRNDFYCDLDGETNINNQLKLFQKLFEWHFDVFGLIEKGLAVEKK